jgi:hypothetical protein
VWAACGATLTQRNEADGQLTERVSRLPIFGGFRDYILNIVLRYFVNMLRLLKHYYFCRIWDSYSGGYEEFYLLGYNAL